MPTEQVFLAFGKLLVSLAFEIAAFNSLHCPNTAGGSWRRPCAHDVPLACADMCQGRQRQQRALPRCKAKLWLLFATQLCGQREGAGSVGHEGFRLALNPLSLGWSPPRDKNNEGDTIG